MCQQLQQSASLSDDELEYAREGATSPPSEAAAPGVSANGTSSGQMDASSADGHGQLLKYQLQVFPSLSAYVIGTLTFMCHCLCF